MKARVKMVESVAILVAFVLSAGAVRAETFSSVSRDLSQDSLPYSDFVSYLNEAVEEGLEYVPSKNSEGLVARFIAGEVALAIASPLAYVEIMASTVGEDIELLARLERFGNESYGVVVVASRDDSPPLKALAIREFVYHSELSSSGYLFPLAILKESGISINSEKMRRVEGGHYDVLNEIVANERFFGAVGTDVLTQAPAQGIEVSKLYPVLTREAEIPYDAIIIRRNLDEKLRDELLGAISMLFLANKTSLEWVFGEGAGVTRIVQARDQDYDIVRRRIAMLNGEGVIKLGLSLNLDPKPEVMKRKAFRAVQDFLFKKYKLFVEVKVYKEDQAETMIEDLENGRIDIAELPPIATGKAIARGFEPVFAPIYDGNPTYAAVLIKNRDNTELQDANALKADVTIAVRPRTSASGYAYPLMGLEGRGLTRSDLNIEERTTSDEIITAVANNNADVGAISQYKLDRARGRGPVGVAKVEEIPNTTVVIPNGAYVIGKGYDADEIDRVKSRFIEASNVLGNLRPEFSAYNLDHSKGLRTAYEWSEDKDTRLLYLILGAIALSLLAGVVFMWKYKPRPE